MGIEEVEKDGDFSKVTYKMRCKTAEEVFWGKNTQIQIKYEYIEFWTCKRSLLPVTCSHSVHLNHFRTAVEPVWQPRFNTPIYLIIYFKITSSCTLSLYLTVFNCLKRLFLKSIWRMKQMASMILITENTLVLHYY